MKIGFKDRMHAMVQQDEDVLFWWSVLCAVAEVDSDTESALLPILVNHYVTIRGFAFAARWVEVFKQTTKKSLQRVKSLRNKLQCTALETSS